MKGVGRRDGSIREDPAECLEAPVEEEPFLGKRSASGSEEKDADQKLEHAA